MEKMQRELFADTLRFLSILFVLIIHTTANYYVSSYGSKSFIIMLILSSITCTAVPIFYMLSGAFLIKEKNSNYSYFYKKVLKILFQTVFWTFVYLLIFKYIMHSDISIIKGLIKSLFSEQIGHLWFMYPLIGLYVITPFISKMYANLNEKDKILIIIILLLIPALICTLQMKYWDLISMPKFAILFPELGLFLSGKYLYEKKEKLGNKKVTLISLLGIIIGLLAVILVAYLYVNNNGISSSKPYFDANKIPNIILIVSIFIFVLSINSFLTKLPNIIKKIITTIGSYSGGIYFTHMIFIYLFPNIVLFGVHFTQNEGRLLNMILGAFLYFIISIIVVLILRKIPLLRKTVD